MGSSQKQQQQESDLAIAVALAMAPDDDDFQCSIPTFSINQDVILKSYKKPKMSKIEKPHSRPNSNPLKSSNNHQHTRRKGKHKVIEGKGNAKETRPLQDITNISFKPHESNESTMIDIPSLAKNNIHNDNEEFVRKDASKGMSIESRLLCRGRNRGLEMGTPLPLAEKDADSPIIEPAAQLSGLVEEGPESLSCEPGIQMNDLVEEGLESLSFEPGTQLNALMQLCCTAERTQEAGQVLDDNCIENMGVEGCRSEGDEEDIMSLMTQASSLYGIPENDLCHQGSSPSRLNNNDSCHENDLGPASTPCIIPTHDLDQTSTACIIPKNDLAQDRSTCRSSADDLCHENRLDNDCASCRSSVDDSGRTDGPCRILHEDLDYQNNTVQASSPCNIFDSDLGQANTSLGIPNYDLGRQQNLVQVSTSCGISSNGVGGVYFLDQRQVLVHCPVCGMEITHLNDQEREAHTNDCLDKDELQTVVNKEDSPKEKVSETVVDITPVLKWLETLGLSRYAEVFIKEEIDWDSLQWLTEEDLNFLGITALGPRRKIVHALHELRKGNSNSTEANANIPKAVANMDDKSQLRESGNKLITEFFNTPSGVAAGQVGCHVETHQREDRTTMISGRKRTRFKTRPSAAILTGIPEWLCIPGTPFRVDAFRYLRGDCSHWFLSHFHTDHYQGLTRGFRHGKVYCSLITARLVNMRIGLSWDQLHVLPLNERVNVDGVYVTAIDANHCPGSVIILFEPPNGKPVLHTGDFRFCQEMVTNPILDSCNIHTLILDTTYCNPQYDFPKQETVIQFVLEAIQAEAFNPRTLFLIGTYTIGKERIFLEVARVLRKKVYVGAAKLRLLGCLGLPEEDMQWLTSNEQESHIHVVPLWTIASFKRMSFISKRYLGCYNSIVAFSPTGWSFGKGKKKTPGKRWQQGTIIRYEVPYSEHSSFTELKEFVKYIAPDNIIPSVNNDSAQAADNMVALLLNEDS